MVSNDTLFKSMDIEQIVEAGILVTMTKIWLSDKDVAYSPTIIFPNKNATESNIHIGNSEIWIPSINIIYGGYK